MAKRMMDPPPCANRCNINCGHRTRHAEKDDCLFNGPDCRPCVPVAARGPYIVIISSDNLAWWQYYAHNGIPLAQRWRASNRPSKARKAAAKLFPGVEIREK